MEVAKFWANKILYYVVPHEEEKLQDVYSNDESQNVIRIDFPLATRPPRRVPRSPAPAGIPRGFGHCHAGQIRAASHVRSLQ